MVDKSRWVELTDANPDHSSWYIERFRTMVAAGDDLGGESRFIDAMAPRGARILDAGCGPGRVGAFLADLGHDVTGIDVDPILIAAAEDDHPGPRWLVGDLAELDLGAQGIADGFDIVLSVGNVMPFLAASTRREVLKRMRMHLRDGGRVVTGFGSGRGYEFSEFFDDLTAVGLTTDLQVSTWDMRPFADDSDFLITVLSPAN